MGKPLKDDWGLETLVSVGESWMPAMLEQDRAGEATDIPVLKLFEFLVASICLFMIEDDAVPERRDFDLFSLAAPPGSGRWVGFGPLRQTVCSHHPCLLDLLSPACGSLVVVVCLVVAASGRHATPQRQGGEAG